MLGFVGVSPASAEEPIPTPAPEATSSTPAPEPEQTEPAPEPEPTEPEPTEPEPTEEPKPTEEPPPPPPPTEEPPPTPAPTEEPTPTPTPDPTQPPAPAPAPGPTAAAAPPAPTAPLLLVGNGPVARIGAPADPNLGVLLAARTALHTAETALRDAKAELAAAVSSREVARGIAESVQTLADEDRAQADIATRAYLAASQGEGTAMSSMNAVFGAGHDLLAGLGGVQRVAQITGDAEKLLAIAALRSEEATAAEERAQAAWDAVDAVPVEALEAAVAEAEGAVTAARTALSGVQSRVASTSLGLVDSLPRDAGQLSQQGWAAPVTGNKSDGFGPRPNKPVAGVNEFHRGTDIAASCGSPLFAATGGVVLEARPNGSYGNWVLIDHGAGVSTGYAHLAVGGILVSAGQTVSPGQLIGAVGSTGASTGCHLHFEVRIGGIAIDAEPFMAARGIGLG